MLLQVSSAIYGYIAVSQRVDQFLSRRSTSYQTLRLRRSCIHYGTRVDENLDDFRIVRVFSANPADKSGRVVSSGNSYVCFDTDR